MHTNQLKRDGNARGGRSRFAAKAAAARENGKLERRPRKILTITEIVWQEWEKYLAARPGFK